MWYPLRQGCQSENYMAFCKIWWVSEKSDLQVQFLPLTASDLSQTQGTWSGDVEMVILPTSQGCREWYIRVCEIPCMQMWVLIFFFQFCSKLVCRMFLLLFIWFIFERSYESLDLIHIFVEISFRSSWLMGKGHQCAHMKRKLKGLPWLPSG